MVKSWSDGEQYLEHYSLSWDVRWYRGWHDDEICTTESDNLLDCSYVFITLTVPRHCYAVIMYLIVDMYSLPWLYCFTILSRLDNVLDCWYVFITQTVQRHCHTAIWHSLHSRLFSRCSRFIGKLEIRPDNPLFPLLINVLLINSLFALGYFWRWIIYPPRRLFCFIISFLLSYLFLPVQ